jgi:hypothetical protein
MIEMYESGIGRWGGESRIGMVFNRLTDRLAGCSSISPLLLLLAQSGDRDRDRDREGEMSELLLNRPVGYVLHVPYLVRIFIVAKSLITGLVEESSSNIIAPIFLNESPRAESCTWLIRIASSTGIRVESQHVNKVW